MRREKRVHAGAVHQTHAPYALLSTADSGGRRGSVFRARQQSQAPRAVGRACVARGEILTFPDTPTTQGLSLWCFNTVSQ